MRKLAPPTILKTKRLHIEGAYPVFGLLKKCVSNAKTIEATTDDKQQINYKVDPARIIISGIFGVRTKNVWW